MKQKNFYMTHRPVADMHIDGVRFDPAIKQALLSQRAQVRLSSEERPNG